MKNLQEDIFNVAKNNVFLENNTISLLIFGLLDPCSLMRFALTNTFYLHLIVEVNQLWQRFVIRQFPQLISQKAIKLYFSPISKEPVHYLVNQWVKPGCYYQLFKDQSISKYKSACFPLIYANDLYALEKFKITFNKQLLETCDSDGNKLWQLIRKNNNPAMNAFIYNNLSESSQNLNPEQLILWGIRLNQSKGLFKALLLSLKDKISDLLIDDFSLIHHAANSNAINSARLLLSMNVNANISTNKGFPLYIASQEGFLEMVNLLVEIGNVDIEKTFRKGYRSLYIAAQNGHLDIVKYLYSKGANLNAECNNGSTALYIAAQNGQAATIEYLLSKGANISSKYAGNFTAIYIAARKGHLAVMQALLSFASKALINEADSLGKTPLYVAADYGYVMICELLLQYGANPNISSNKGYTALYAAAKHGYICIVEALLKYKANFLFQSLDKAIPLYMAAQNGHHQVVELLCDYDNSQAHMLYRYNSAHNFINGYSPIYVAAQNGHLAVIKVLVKHCKDKVELHKLLNSVTDNNTTPLYVAIRQGEMDIAQFLVEQGADVNISTDYGHTPLHALCLWQSKSYKSAIDFLKILIPAGVNILVKNTSNLRASQLPDCSPRLKAILKLLEEIAILWKNKASDNQSLPQFDYLTVTDQLKACITKAGILDFTLQQLSKKKNNIQVQLCLSLLDKMNSPFGYNIILYVFLSSKTDSKLASIITAGLGFNNAVEKAKTCLLNCISGQVYEDDMLKLDKYVIQPLLNLIDNHPDISSHQYDIPLLICNFFEVQVKKLDSDNTLEFSSEFREKFMHFCNIN